MTQHPDENWLVGLEIEVALDDLGLARWQSAIAEPYDIAPQPFCRDVARILREVTGKPFKSPRRLHSGFQVVPEYDLDPTFWPHGPIAGVEIITAPLPIAETLEVWSSIEDILDFHGYVNENCGLHINVSHPDIEMDPSRFIIASNEPHTLYWSRRLGSDYTHTQDDVVVPALLAHLKDDPDARLLTPDLFPDIVKPFLGRDKSFAANFSKLEQGYIEMRHYGLKTILEDTVSMERALDGLLTPLEMDEAAYGIHVNRYVSRLKSVRSWLDGITPRLQLSDFRPHRMLGGHVADILLDGKPVAVYRADHAPTLMPTDDDWAYDPLLCRITMPALNTWRESFARLVLLDLDVRELAMDRVPMPEWQKDLVCALEIPF